MTTLDALETRPVEYASLMRRFLALILDGLILMIPIAIAENISPYLGSILILLLYGPIFESSTLQATLGKYLCGIQVADLSGRRITFKAALIRNLLKIVSGLIILIGFIFALFSSRKQALHDMLADTVVVYGRSEQPITDAWVSNAKTVFKQTSEAVSEKTSAMGGGSNESKLAQLERLQALRERGALTEEEFQAEKSRILGR